MLKNFGEVLSPQQIKCKYKSLVIPHDLVGIDSKDGGLINLKKTLETFKKMSIQNGAELLYSTKVKDIEH